MAKYVVLFPLKNRAWEKFSEKEIECAAEVFFFANTPEGSEVISRLEFEHIKTLFGQEIRMVRVIGDVTPGPEEELANAKDEG